MLYTWCNTSLYCRINIHTWKCIYILGHVFITQELHTYELGISWLIILEGKLRVETCIKKDFNTICHQSRNRRVFLVQEYRMQFNDQFARFISNKQLASLTLDKSWTWAFLIVFSSSYLSQISKQINPFVSICSPTS